MVLSLGLFLVAQDHSLLIALPPHDKIFAVSPFLIVCFFSTLENPKTSK